MAELCVLDAHFVFWTAASFKTLLAQSFHFWPAAALRQALRSAAVPRTLTGNATRSPSDLPAKLFPLGAGMAPIDRRVFCDPARQALALGRFKFGAIFAGRQPIALSVFCAGVVRCFREAAEDEIPSF
jgi:hypothetical protein